MQSKNLKFKLNAFPKLRDIIPTCLITSVSLICKNTLTRSAHYVVSVSVHGATYMYNRFVYPIPPSALITLNAKQYNVTLLKLLKS